MKRFSSGRNSHHTSCRYVYCKMKVLLSSCNKPIYQGAKCSLAVSTPLLHWLRKYPSIIAEKLAHPKDILKGADMRTRTEKNIDSHTMSIFKAMLMTYPESSMGNQPHDLLRRCSRTKRVCRWVMGLNKGLEKLSYAREIEKNGIVNLRKKNNKGHNTSL